MSDPFDTLLALLADSDGQVEIVVAFLEGRDGEMAPYYDLSIIDQNDVIRFHLEGDHTELRERLGEVPP